MWVTVLLVSCEFRGVAWVHTKCFPNVKHSFIIMHEVCWLFTTNRHSNRNVFITIISGGFFSKDRVFCSLSFLSLMKNTHEIHTFFHRIMFLVLKYFACANSKLQMLFSSDNMWNTQPNAWFWCVVWFMCFNQFYFSIIDKLFLYKLN